MTPASYALTDLLRDMHKLMTERLPLLTEDEQERMAPMLLSVGVALIDRSGGAA